MPRCASASFRFVDSRAHLVLILAAQALIAHGCEANLGFVGVPKARDDGSEYFSSTAPKQVGPQRLSFTLTWIYIKYLAKRFTSKTGGHFRQLLGPTTLSSWRRLEPTQTGLQLRQVSASLLTAAPLFKSRYYAFRMCGPAGSEDLFALPCASLVLAIFATFSPHGTAFAPLSSCTEVPATCTLPAIPWTGLL